MTNEPLYAPLSKAANLPLTLIILLLLALYVAVVALVPIRADNDVWWHVKTGMYIVENGLPKTDVFNFMAEDLPWHNHEWLAQLLIYGCHVLGERFLGNGFAGVVVAVGVTVYLTLLVLFFLSLRMSGSGWIALLLCVLFVAVGRRMFYPRPPVLSNLLLAITILLLLAVSRGWFRKRWLVVLPPLIALWTNLHGAWMAAGVILGFWAIEQAAARIIPAGRELFFSRPLVVLEWRPLSLLLVACLLATLCNPFGYHLYALPGRVLSDLELVRAIGELRSPDFFFVIDFQLVIIGTLFLAFVVRPLRMSFFEVAIYLFFLHQAIQHVRHLSLFSVMMVPLLASLLAGVGLQIATVYPRLSRWYGPAIAALAVYTMSWVVLNPREGVSYIERHQAFLSGQAYERDRFPASVADYIEFVKLEGRMFNQNHYAGYLIWRLSPEQHRVFSDSRFDIFGGEIMRLENAVVAGNPQRFRRRKWSGALVEVPSWREVLDENNIQWLIVLAGTRLEAVLADSREDFVPTALWPNGFQIWIRNTEENQAMIRRARETAPLAGAITPQQ